MAAYNAAARLLPALFAELEGLAERLHKPVRYLVLHVGNVKHLHL